MFPDPEICTSVQPTQTGALQETAYQCQVAIQHGCSPWRWQPDHWQLRLPTQLVWPWSVLQTLQDTEVSALGCLVVVNMEMICNTNHNNTNITNTGLFCSQSPLEDHLCGRDKPSLIVLTHDWLLNAYDCRAAASSSGFNALTMSV